MTSCTTAATLGVAFGSLAGEGRMDDCDDWDELLMVERDVLDEKRLACALQDDQDDDIEIEQTEVL